MKTSKIVKAAIWAKGNGYAYMTSIVKSHFATDYFHVVLIDDILKKGKWIPANYVSMYPGKNGTWRGRVGISTKNLPEKSIRKSFAIYKSENHEKGTEI